MVKTVLTVKPNMTLFSVVDLLVRDHISGLRLWIQPTGSCCARQRRQRDDQQGRQQREAVIAEFDAGGTDASLHAIPRR